MVSVHVSEILVTGSRLFSMLLFATGERRRRIWMTALLRENVSNIFVFLKLTLLIRVDRLELAVHECVLCMQCLCGKFSVISKIMT